MLVMHPFLMLGAAWWEQTVTLLDRIATLAARGQVRCLTGAEAACGQPAPDR